MRVLVVHDDGEVRDLVRRALAREGHGVALARSLTEARRSVAERVPDLVVVDVTLGDGSGVAWCSKLRRAGHELLIIMLVARAEWPRRFAAFDAGADDVLAQPFAVPELQARVRAMARRAVVPAPLAPPTLLALGQVLVDVSARRATRHGAEVAITPREWAVLVYLSERRGSVIARTEILERIWRERTEKSNASLDAIIARLRRKLGAEVIRTIRGTGYAIDAD
ncbi:MAG: response regulator transcription factor [Polyangiaceae bacterium]